MEAPASAGMTARERVLLELARRDKTDALSTFQAITEAAGTVLDVARVSIWQLQGSPPTDGLADDTRLVCRDLYLLDQKSHVSFLPIHGRDFPTYLRAINERRTIAADDARNDPRTREFAEFYLKPLGISSMMDVPIWHHGQVWGVLCFEHVGEIRHWQPDEEAFAINMTDLISACLISSEHVAVTQRWKTVIEAVTEAIAVMDQHGTLLQFNRAMYERFLEPAGQYRTMEDRQQAWELMDAADRPIPADDWPTVRVMRGEMIRGEIYGLVVKRTGARHYVRLTACPVIEDGLIRYVVLVLADTTEEVFFERLKRDLLSGLAHELKTPLAIAKGYAEQLRSSRDMPCFARPQLDAIVRSCDRMNRLIETLLDISSVILGRLRLTREHVDLSALLRSAVKRAEQSWPNHRFVVKPHAGVCVTVDSARIMQALRQMLDNAVAFSPDGGSIDVELESDPEWAVVSVRDRGVGIPARCQRSIFTPFFKAHAMTELDAGGLGTGLYLAREIARRHGGDLWFDSVEGQGSTFRLKLPREAA
jgi:signal transduction histidine kinase